MDMEQEEDKGCQNGGEHTLVVESLPPPTRHRLNQEQQQPRGNPNRPSQRGRQGDQHEDRHQACRGETRDVCSQN